MEEKRRFPRFKVYLRGEFEVEGEMRLSPQVHMVDFCRDGLKVVTPQKMFLESNVVNLTFYLPNRAEPIALQGKIRWMRPVGADWEMGMRLEKMDPADKTEILDYAYKRWREEKPEG